jgi:hypothetical protein
VQNRWPASIAVPHCRHADTGAAGVTGGAVAAFNPWPQFTQKRLVSPFLTPQLVQNIIHP